MKKEVLAIVIFSVLFGVLVPQKSDAQVLCVLLCFLNHPAGDARNECLTDCLLCRTADGAQDVVLDAPPSCVLTSVTPTAIAVRVQDSSGLAGVLVTTAENADVSVPIITEGTTDSVLIQATKIDSTQRAQVALAAVDVCGQVTQCDPVMTSVIRSTGKPVTDTYANLPEEEGIITIFNNTPGLRVLDIIVNGELFKIKHLADGEERTIDVSSAMHPGGANIITLKSQGKPEASAGVLIWDGKREN